MAKNNEVESKWYIIDASQKPLGRVAAEAAKLLRGKHKPTFTPNQDTGDHVIILNCKDVILTGKKLDQKIYRHHSGYIGGMKEISAKDMLSNNPEKAMMLAIKGMLPHNRLGRKMISLTKRKELKGYKSLKAYPEVAHFVTTRHGGISSGAYASFNCSPYTNDSSMNLIRNRHWLFQLMKWEIQELFIAEQRHGAASMVIDKWYFDTSEGIRQDLLIGIDALITNVPGYCVCVTTADCVPVLLYDKKLQVVAAIHAGWKGTVKHIVSNVLEHMNQKFGTQGEDVIACIGPSISLASFEVGDEVYEAFKESGFDMSLISVKKRRHICWYI